MLTEYNPQTLCIVDRDFYAGFREATIDFELKYRRQAIPIEDMQLAMIFIRITAEDRSDLWKAGYQAGFFAAFYGVLYRLSISSSWTLGEMARVQYRLDCVRSGA